MLKIATVTPQDVEKYFGESTSRTKHYTSEKWNISKDGKKFKVTSEVPPLTLELEPVKTVYNISVEAVDDSSDYTAGETDNPVKFIVNFLKTGEYAEELLSKVSSDPNFISHILNTLAFKIDLKRIDSNHAKKTLRRVSVILTSGKTKVSADGREEFELLDLAKIKSDMKDKGWVVKVDYDDRSLPVLHVNMSDIYTATVKIKGILWNYMFMVTGDPETQRSGSTDDPIKALDKYRNAPGSSTQVESGQFETEPVRDTERV